MNLRRLGHGIRQRTPRRLDPCQTRRRHKAARTLFEMGQRRLDKPKMGLDVEHKAPVPVVVLRTLGEVQEVGYAGPAGVGDDDVYAAHFLAGFFDQVKDGGFLAHVGADGVEAWIGGRGVRAGDGVEFGEEFGGADGVVGVVYDLEHCSVRVGRL